MLSLLLFMLKTIDPQDLAFFMEKGATDILDTEVSPNPDDDGNYLVFVEIKMKTLWIL